MKTLFVSGSDTGVGKTRVTGALARVLAATGAKVQVVKPVETGRPLERDADAARRLAGRAAGAHVTAHTLWAFAEPLAPLAAAAQAGQVLAIEALVAQVQALPSCDWRIVEGAGGLAVPLADDGQDWTDFARLIAADAVVLVVPDRLGAINQARLVYAYAEARGLNAGLWLNAAQGEPDPAVAKANRAGLVGLPLWATQAYAADEPDAVEAVRGWLMQLQQGETEKTRPSAAVRAIAAPIFKARYETALAQREADGLRRRLRVLRSDPARLNLAANDYLALARDPAVVAAAARGAARQGASASASPLVTGWSEGHETLAEELAAWHGFAAGSGLLWTSGFAANVGVLGTLPQAGDLVLADRLIHHSMVAGILKSGARLQRYPHLDLDALERQLEKVEPGRAVFVVTETVFSMDGDYPDLGRLAELRRRFGFCWVVDEAHALGWYGPGGAGLVAEAGVAGAVDVLVGTLGKTLASGGAYSLFGDSVLRDHVINQAGEFIYSTALPPPAVEAARAAVRRVQALASGQVKWRARSRAFRAALRAAGWAAAEGDAPIVPVTLGDPARALAVAAALRAEGIEVAAVRPPTVPAGTSRLRFSLTREFGAADQARVLAALARARKASGV